MLDFAPSTDEVRPPAVDGVAPGLGRAVVEAIVAGDFDHLERLFAPDVRFRAIVPGECLEASTAAGARAHLEDWFGGTDARVLLGAKVDLVGDRLVFGYRIELTDVGIRRIVEQHVVATVGGVSLRDVSLLCSGFRPVGTDPKGPVGP